jgi:phospholipid/cholesterol/gamma-HCH transport system substrate-binding protein
MKSERKAEIKVGITTILSLIIFIWIMGWAKNFMRTSSDVVINVMFDNVSGLEVDDIVTVRGLRKGFVKDILLDNNILIVRISLDESVKLRKDAEFWLATVDLMGDKKIEVLPGRAKDPLDYNVIHKGLFLPDLNSMLSMIGAMKEDLTMIVKDVKTSLEAVNSYLTDEEMKSDLKTSLKNLNGLTYKLDVMLTENRENISTITKNTAVISEDAKQFLDENKEDLTVSVSKLKALLTKSDSLVNKLNYLASQTLDGENNIGKILYDDSLVVKLSETFDMLKKLSRIVLYQLKQDGVKIDANIW